MGALPSRHPLTEAQLIKSAHWCCDGLLQEIVERGLAENMLKSYTRAASDQELHESVRRMHNKALNGEDYQRVLFEVLCFSAAVMMSWQAPQYITTRGGLFQKARPDVARVREFNGFLLDHILARVAPLGFERIREIGVTGLAESPRPGERSAQIGERGRLDLQARVLEYLRVPGGGGWLSSWRARSRYSSRTRRIHRCMQNTIGWVARRLCRSDAKSCCCGAEVRQSPNEAQKVACWS